MVASEPVGPVDELPLYLPTEMEAGSAPSRVYMSWKRRNAEVRLHAVATWLLMRGLK